MKNESTGWMAQTEDGKLHQLHQDSFKEALNEAEEVYGPTVKCVRFPKSWMEKYNITVED